MNKDYTELAREFDQYREEHEPREFAVAVATSRGFELTVYLLFSSAQHECFVYSVVARAHMTAEQVVYGTEPLADSVALMAHAVGAWLPDETVQAVVAQAQRGTPFQLKPIEF